MTITEDMLRERMTTLAAARERALAEANAYDGAYRDCEYWLKQLKAEPEQEPADVPTPDDQA